MYYVHKKLYLVIKSLAVMSLTQKINPATSTTVVNACLVKEDEVLITDNKM